VIESEKAALAAMLEQTRRQLVDSDAKVSSGGLELLIRVLLVHICKKQIPWMV
jgi:hypothetical protein